MGKSGLINRRAFLKYSLVQASALALAVSLKTPFKPTKDNLPGIRLGDLPYSIQTILSSAPNIKIGDDGYMEEYDRIGNPLGRVPLQQTQWNRERNNSFERLFMDVPWGIVLHWFGATIDGDDSLAGYMRGFDGLRFIDDYETRTSAHFLVGSAAKNVHDNPKVNPIGIIQTQAPDVDGTPLVASHLHALDYEAHKKRQQYFVRAFYQLNSENPAIRSILTNFFDGPLKDPNYRTIAIEITGADFDTPGNMPPTQQIANVLSVVIAVMKRYRITILNLFGHHEIELRKSDPGKNFIALIRYLVGIKALVDKDFDLQTLVFGALAKVPRNDSVNNLVNDWNFVKDYFTFLRDYYVLVGYPDQVFRWEVNVNYWDLRYKIAQNAEGNGLVDEVLQVKTFKNFELPIHEPVALKGDYFLDPSNHEGVDLFLANNPYSFQVTPLTDINLSAEGRCIYTGYGATCSNGYLAIFRHRQNDGGEVLSIYGNLANLGNINVGNDYRQGHRIGTIQTSGPLGEGYLHFAIAYGATWDTFLKNRPVLPISVQPNWIKRRYISPMEYFKRWQAIPNSGFLPY